MICSTASNRIIHAKDHASIQINLADVDETTGRMLDTSKTYAICGDIRRMVRNLYGIVRCDFKYVKLTMNLAGRVRWLYQQVGEKRRTAGEVSFNVFINSFNLYKFCTSEYN